VFHVKITSVVNGTASFVSVSVLRPAEIAGDKGSKVYSGPVTVWHRGILLTGSTNIMALQIRDSLRDAIAEFVAQYHKENPEVTSALGPPLSDASAATLHALPNHLAKLDQLFIGHKAQTSNEGETQET